MIDHTGIGVADVAQSALFYDAALSALGMRRVYEMKNDGALEGIGYGFDFPLFWIDRFHPPAQRYHTGFRAKSPEAVNSFYEKALAAGGKDNGKPGYRKGQSTEIYYAAFVIDPDGNNMEAVYRGPLPRD